MDLQPLEVALPKWPALVVEGRRVSPELAAEILIRTDYHMPDFTYAGNDRELRDELNALFALPEEKNWRELGEVGREMAMKDTAHRFAAIDQLRQDLRHLDLAYLQNQRIVSSWIGGPHGWLNWDGHVGCSNYNIGKWPSVEAVHKDWELIAAAFPTLELKAWLYDHESGEERNVAVVRFEVSGGKVLVFVQEPSDTLPGAATGLDINTACNLLAFTPTRLRESGITPVLLKEKLAQVYPEGVPQFKP